MLLILPLLTSCSQNDDPDGDDDANLNLFIKTTAASDNLAKDGDDSFMSLAIYIFNKADGYREYSELIPEFTPQALQEFSRSVNVSKQTKIIYAVANYNDPQKTYNTPIAENLTMQQLDALTVVDTGFSGDKILMIGKKEVNIDSESVIAEVPMERLVARLDIYLFKNQKLANSQLIVSSVEFNNQVLNTNGAYQNTTMLSPIITNREMGVLTENNTLTTMPDDASVIVPDNANISFYTYQNIPASSTPDDAISPFIRIKVNINGVDYTYKGYLTDEGQVNKYRLNRNTVYTVVAMLDQPDDQLILNVQATPWTVTGSQTGGTISDSDYSLDAYNGNDQGATTGTVQFPYVDANGATQNQTSYASYSFKLTGPIGKVWTATISNGLDFEFGTEGSTSNTLAVSRGIARSEPYEIRVGAQDYWGGEEKKTYMYIIADGQKLKINPVQSNGQRKFPGNSDTDVLITQTSYQ